MRLTTSTIAKLTLPDGVSERIFWDDDLPGFGLRLRAGGSQTFVAQYDFGRKTRRMSLGSSKLLGLSAARASARDILARVRLGEDPQAAKAQARVAASETFSKYIGEYLTWKEPQVRPSTFREVERYLTRHATPWHARQLASITALDAAELVKAIAAKHGASTANRARVSISPYFAWHIASGRLLSNPLAFTPAAPENGPRNRVLSDAELAAVWRACGDDHFGSIVRLLMTTAARRSEIGGLSWDDYSDGLITIAAERTKNGRAHEIPLSTLARDILERQPRRNSTPYVFGRVGTPFSGWSLCKAELDKKLAGVVTVPWTLHDLRRSTATGLGELRVLPHVIESVLNHVSGFRAGVAGIYNHASYREQKAEALQRWADHLATII